MLLLAFMFRTPLLRLQQTATHFTAGTGLLAKQAFSTTAAIKQNNDTMSDEKPTGLIAKSGLELLTFGTPNGMRGHRQ